MPTIRFRALITRVAPPAFASRALRIFSVSCLLLSLVFAAAPVPTAHAATTFTVNSTTDAVDNSIGDGVCATAGSVCTLRAAIQEANALAGDDTITVPAGTYTLTIAGTSEDAAATGDLDITSNITINGAGAGSTIIDGGALDRVFHVTGVFTVNISGVTVRNGNSGAGASGGGIYNSGTLTISNSTFSGNSALVEGGGIFIGSGPVTITNSTFSGNSASNVGGGIFIGSGPVTVTNSTFSGNSTTIGGGGGIYVSGGPVTVTNSTFSGNSGAGAFGGGIYRINGTVTLKNTIVANSTSGGDCSGTVTDGGNNIVEDNTCGFTGGVDPNLGALTGSPAYFPLNSGSAAIDAGTNTGCPTDSQNGVTRPADGDGNGTATCDIGSYEAPPVPAASACILSATFSGSAAVSNGNPYYLNCFYGQVFVDNGEGRATGGNHFQGSATITDTGFTVCIQVPAGYTAASPTCVTDSGGGRKDFGIRPIAQAQSQTTTGAQSVGATGGAFNCASRWTLTIPAGVLPDNSSLQCGAFDPNVTTGAPAGFKFMGQMINVLILDNTGAARRTFNPPLTVCVTYTDADVLAAGGDPNNFVIQTADIGGAWVTMTTTVNTTTQQVCATTDHLTLFELTTKVPTSLPVTGQDFTPFIIIAALLAGALAAGVLVRR